MRSYKLILGQEIRRNLEKGAMVRLATLFLMCLYYDDFKKNTSPHGMVGLYPMRTYEK